MAAMNEQQNANMTAKPDFIALPPRMPGSTTPAAGSRGGSPLHSPRIPFVTGEGTPAMSPLDAFAAQSRLLAKQLDNESKRVGHRVSRLPHDQVAEQLARRPRHLSPQASTSDVVHEQQGLSPLEEDAGGEKPEIETIPPDFRPKSFYPRFSAVTAASETSSLPPSSPIKEEPLMRAETVNDAVPNDYFGIARNASPEPGAPGRTSFESTSQSSYARSGTSFDSNYRQVDLHRGGSIESSQSSKSLYARDHHHSLLPPNPPYARKAPSIRSVDSDSSSVGSRQPDGELRRKTSFGSGTSGPLSPTSPHVRTTQLRRTPSQTSELSINNNRLSRPAFNFSRPISRQQESVPSRMSSIESHTHPRYHEASLHTPTSAFYEPLTPTSFVDAQSINGDFPSQKSEDEAGTYTHSTYSLPRGRMVSRDSIPLDNMMPAFSWENKPPGPGHQHHANTWPKRPDETFIPPANQHRSRPSQPTVLEDVRPSIDSTRSMPAPAPAPLPASLQTSTRGHNMNRHSMTSMSAASMSAASMNSGSTIKAGSTHRKQKSDGEMTAEDHLNKGIECHEKGSLNESTYHLRLAANSGNSTAMMLYALACRHGWGMRQSPSDAVMWLRKAMDVASIEMSNGNDAENDKRLTPEEREAKKSRKAQFALSVYELGVSHMKGWGIEQDKALALRCYEIAASWGDADAMAETGFCYAQGQGCKKDLKKAARWYREAEKKGVSMVGNSWIYKSKYDEDPVDDGRTGRHEREDGKKKQRDKSRTRSIFGRKKT